MKRCVYVMALVLLCSCTNEKKSGSSDLAIDLDSVVDLTVTDVTSSEIAQNDKVDLRRASIIAQSFVEEKMGNCDFDDLDYRGEETQVENRFKVLQKFEHKNEQYVYKIYVQYKGKGEWEDRNNWTYGTLIIENTLTGKQYRYDGTMKEEEKRVPDGVFRVAGIDFKIAEKNGKAIRIYTNKKLSLKEAKSVIRELYRQYDVIQLAKYPKINRGEEYYDYMNGMIIDNDNDEDVIKFNPAAD